MFQQYLSVEKSGVMVENKAIIASKDSELHLYETVTQCKDVQMKFSLPVFAFMLKGDKFIDMEGIGKFNYKPGSSLIIPSHTNLKIDFPTACLDNPVQCMAFVPDEKIVEETKYDFYNRTDASINIEKQVNLKDGAHLQDIGIMHTIQYLVFLFQENNPHRDYFINLTMKELITRVLQSKARTSFLHFFNSSENVMSRVAQYIRDHIQEPLSIEKLASVAGMSRSKFYEQFKLVFGMSPNRYVIQEKVEKAKTLITCQQKSSITEIAYSLGYADSAYFSKQFKEITGLSPSAFHKRSLNQVLSSS